MPFMELEFSLLSSQQSASGPYPEPDASSSQILTLFPIHSNFIVPSALRSSELLLPFRFSDQHFMRISYFSFLSCVLHAYPILPGRTSDLLQAAISVSRTKI